MNMNIIKIDDYKNADGSTDYKAYNAATIENGEYCYKCDAFIVWHKGYRDLCYNCKAFRKR